MSGGCRPRSGCSDALQHVPAPGSPGAPNLCSWQPAAYGGDVASSGDGITIGQVSALLGVPVPTLRSWQRRYGLVAPGRTVGGHRRYGKEDVEVLQAMRSAVGRGLAAGSAAQALRAPRPAPDVPLSLLSMALERAAACDPAGFAEVLDRAEEEMGTDRTVDRLLVPALREIGDRWERGELDVGAEHLATAAARRWVARRTGGSSARGRTTPVPRTAPVLLAAAPDNQHTVALEAFGMLLDARGWPTRLLGADTPVPALLRAVDATGAQAVVLTAQQVSRRRPAVAALTALATRPVRLYFAGAAFDSVRHRRDVPGTYLGTVLPEAVDLVAGELTPG